MSARKVQTVFVLVLIVLVAACNESDEGRKGASDAPPGFSRRALFNAPENKVVTVAIPKGWTSKAIEPGYSQIRREGLPVVAIMQRDYELETIKRRWEQSGFEIERNETRDNGWTLVGKKDDDHRVTRYRTDLALDVACVKAPEYQDALDDELLKKILTVCESLHMQAK